MRNKRIMIPGVAVLFMFGMLAFLGACSSGQRRVDATDVSRPVVTQTPSAEEREAEARRNAEAETLRKTDTERRAQLEKAAVAETQKFRDEAQIFEMDPVYFDFDSSDIKPEFRPLLEQKAAWMKAYPAFIVRIEGHCDDRGTAEYNLALGEKRALRVTDYLVNLGVPAKRLSTISYGEERPAVRGQDEAAWAKNRRAEFRVMK